eukprot:scaffold81572_cov19-Tisochrysis_lutea.AAC.1
MKAVGRQVQMRQGGGFEAEARPDVPYPPRLSILSNKHVRESRELVLQRVLADAVGVEKVLLWKQGGLLASVLMSAPLNPASMGEQIPGICSNRPTQEGWQAGRPC